MDGCTPSKVWYNACLSIGNGFVTCSYLASIGTCATTWWTRGRCRNPLGVSVLFGLVKIGPALVYSTSIDVKTHSSFLSFPLLMHQHPRKSRSGFVVYQANGILVIRSPISLRYSPMLGLIPIEDTNSSIIKLARSDIKICCHSWCCSTGHNPVI